LGSTGSNQNKDCSLTHPIKQAHTLSGKTFVVIDERLTRKLAINEYDTWFEQIPTVDGILLKIIRHSRPGDPEDG
jgi:hypothetical protein